MKPTEQQIEDCRVRGIVPGAVIQDASGLGRGTVSPYREWSLVEGALGRYISCGIDKTGLALFAKHANNRFATVLTPAPKPATLTPGMACLIPSAAGRQWIKELAEAKGVWGGEKDVTSNDYSGVWVMDSTCGKKSGLLNVDASPDCSPIVIPLHEFIRLLMEYEPPVPPKTTEELLKEALKHVDALANIGASHWIGAQREARAFLKSIKP